MLLLTTLLFSYVVGQAMMPGAEMKPAQLDPTDLLKQLNLNGQMVDMNAVAKLTMTDTAQMTATTDPAMSQETLDVACAKAAPCAPGLFRFCFFC
jgi:hypothetical protein